MLRVRLVFWYMLWCVRIGARPWRYFQLNAPWFNSNKQLFSKLDTDALIPDEWRLHQEPLNTRSAPKTWPVFLKPEWGQNACGIMVAMDQSDFDNARRDILSGRIPYLFQEAAKGKREFEIFYIRRNSSGPDAGVLSVTETLNSNTWPVNSILNPDTRHKALGELAPDRKQKLWKQMRKLPAFRIARVGLRADSLDAVLAGQFQIIEINLFVPMPLCLLDDNIPLKERRQFIHSSMLELARLTKSVPLSQPRKNIFWPMLFLNYRMHA